MIMSLKAASLGLNLVAASHVLLLDVWWNPTTEDQAIDRAHRIGQSRTVNVSRLAVRATIEDRILALQVRACMPSGLPPQSLRKGTADSVVVRLESILRSYGDVAIFPDAAH